MSGRNFRCQFLRGALIGLLLVPTILMCFVVGLFFFGYRFEIAYGSSMEPALSDGDMIWVKYLDIADVKIGDIVTLEHPSEGATTHRVIKMQPLPQGGYLLETKGDANFVAEAWKIGADERVAVAVARVRFAGYVVDFLGSALLISLAVATVAAMWVRRRRMAHGGE